MTLAFKERVRTSIQLAPGAGYVACSCGWKSKVVDDGRMFEGDYKSAGSLFDEHICMEKP